MRIRAVFLPTDAFAPSYDTGAAGLYMTEYPQAEDPALWQEPGTVYGRESAVLRSTADRLRYMPRKITFTFRLPDRDRNHDGLAYRAPVLWEQKVKDLREAVDGKRLRARVTASDGGVSMPLRYDPSSGRMGRGETTHEDGCPLYYEGIVTVGAPRVSGANAEIEVHMLADPWVCSEELSRQITLRGGTEKEPAPITENDPRVWPTDSALAGLTAPFIPSFAAVAATGSGGTVPDANRIRVRQRFDGGTTTTYSDWYPLFLLDGNGGVVDSGNGNGSGLVPMQGDVDWDPATKRFTALPIRFENEIVPGAQKSLRLEFCGMGGVTVYWKVGERT